MDEPLISLCHSTARLPDGWVKACRDWCDKADHRSRIEYILGVDHSRRSELYPVPVLAHYNEVNRLAYNHGRRCAVDGWNATARFSSGKLLITVSDDWFPPEHWDIELLKCIPDLDDEYVLDVDNQDGAVNMLPFSILTRAYLERLTRDHGYQGGFFYPEYLGMQADRDMYYCAKMDDVIINARHLKFTHLNPDTDSDCTNAGTAEWDDTYRWQRREEAQETGRRVLSRRAATGFRD